MNKAWFFLILISAFSAAQAQGIYRWVDDNGVTHFGDAPMSREATRVEVQVNHPVPPPPTMPTPTASQPAAIQPEIVMYGAAWCGVCKQARGYFSQYNIRYTEYDIDTSAKGKRDYKRMNGKAVPIFLVDGQRHQGFSASSFDALLGR